MKSLNNSLRKKELAPNIYGIIYQKKITRKRLLRDFKDRLGVDSFPTGPTLILLRS